LIVGIRLPPITWKSPRLSSFCKISRDTSFSELISGTTSSCNATFLYSIFEDTAAWLAITFEPTTFVSVLVGIGTSWPEAMIAFLLLLVKTVVRERILNRQ